MKTIALRGLLIGAAALVLCAPAAPAQTTGDSMSSDNVEFVKNLREVGDGVGATVIGNTMFVTSTTHLTIYDITDAENPVREGVFTLNVEWENEEVPTNGKILGIAGSLGCVVLDRTNPSEGLSGSGTSCLTIYDVSDPANVKLLRNVPDAGQHTHTCVLECTYFFGSEGLVVDARDPAKAQIVEDFNWESYLAEKYSLETKNSCHHQREIQPGIVLGSCNPVVLFSVRPEDGASITDPVLLALGTAEDPTLIHSSRWPRQGKDKFVLVGQETNAEPQCTDAAAAFQTWDGSKARASATPFSFTKGSAITLIDEFRPSNGTYVDGRNPFNALGCSVHWFQEHPTFNNGGLVAVAAYENGTRLLQVAPDGKLTEQGYFQPLGGSTSAPHWHPSGKVFYNIDYTRGLDVIRYTGDSYVPTGSGDVVPDPNATPGTGGEQPSDQPPCASAAGFRSTKVTPRGKTVTFGVDRREQQPFTVDVFQQSQGSTVVKERLVARFANKTAGFKWNGTDRKKRKLRDGNYFVRFTMKQANGMKDVRRATLTRKGGKFRKAPDFFQRVDCGIFSALKLSSSVFGGTNRVPLGISYKLNVPAKSVKVQVKVGSKTVKTFKGKGARGKTMRFTLKHTAVSKGKTVKVLVTPDRGGQTTATYTLVAKRI